MHANGATRLGFVVVAGLAIMACGRSEGARLRALDGGAIAPDVAAPFDLTSDPGAVHADADVAAVDSARDAPVFVPDGISLDAPLVNREVAQDRKDLGPDGRDIGPDSGMGRAQDGPDGGGRDAAVDGGGALACREGLVPGSLPLLPTGSHPVSLTSGDLNGDGRLDLVVANYDSNTVSVMLGLGAGRLAAKVDYPTGASPRAVVMGDLTGDGKMDLATANYLGATVSVLIGKGDGTFTAQSDRAFTNHPSSLALGDLNGDGRLDMVAGSLWPGGVTVALGLGDGTFAAERTYTAGSYPTSVALGDLDGDGQLDLVAANAVGGSVSILLGQGDGTFASKVDYPAGSFAYAVGLGDLDGDGRLDIAVANANSNTVSVLLGKGDGSFSDMVVYTSGQHMSTDDPRVCYPNSLRLGDVNADGRLDLVVVNEMSATVSVLLGTGDGAFARNIEYPTGAYPSSVGLGDLNGDGIPDLFATNHESDSVSVLPGLGAGAFSPWAAYATANKSSAMALGDLNGDGQLDVVAASSLSDTVTVLLGAAAGTFVVQAPFHAGDPLATYVRRFLALGDLDGDGRLDLVTGSGDRARSGALSVLLGKGDGTFGGQVDYPVADLLMGVGLGDFNRDGNLDMVAATQKGSLGALGRVSVWLGKGDGTFATKVDYEAGIQPYSLALGDLNGDDRPDLIVLNNDSVTSETLTVLLGKGDGTFGARASSKSAPERCSPTLGDVNADGRVDLVVAEYDANSVTVLAGNGDGTFSAGRAYQTGLEPESVALGDLNGDGKVDLVTASLRSSTLSVLFGMGDGGFAPPVDYPAWVSPVALRDLNGDGRLDLLGVSGAGTVDVLIRSCGPGQLEAGSFPDAPLRSGVASER